MTDTDLVERLRDPYIVLTSMVVRLEAADEIERLRAALETLLTDPPATLDEPDMDADVVIKMRAIARAALEER